MECIVFLIELFLDVCTEARCSLSRCFYGGMMSWDDWILHRMFCREIRRCSIVVILTNAESEGVRDGGDGDGDGRVT